MTDATCSVDGCDIAPRGRGMCNKHYLRWRRHGSTDDARRAKPVDGRFWSQIDGSGDCWLWTGYVGTHGYGVLRYQGVPTPAHRVAYILCVGDIPRGFDIDHRCHNRRCVNPEHLQAVTHQKNGENLRGAARTSSTGVRGVWVDRARHAYGVTVKVHGKSHFGGRFSTVEEAEAAAIALRNRLMTNNLVDRQAA